MLEAIGINCPGDETNTIQATNVMIDANNDASWRVVSQYGNPHWVPNTDPWISPSDDEIQPNTSSTFLVMTTGEFSTPNNLGLLLEPPASQGGSGENNNNDDPGPGGLPQPLTAQYGSNNGNGGTPFMDCDGANDCSDSLYQWWITNGWNNSNDTITVQFEMTAPVETYGFVFDVAFFSSEFPVYYDTQYNDQFVVWSTSSAYTGNLTFINGAPLTITSLEDAGAFAFKANDPELVGTGYESSAATDWAVTRGAVEPGETFQLTFFLADLSDSALASAAAIDNFRWECSGCIVSEVDDCGVVIQ